MDNPARVHSSRFNTETFIVRETGVRPTSTSVRQKAFEVAMLDGNENLAYRIKQFQFRDTRSKAASDIEDITAASKLLGHSKERITKDKYRRNGETVNPSK